MIAHDDIRELVAEWRLREDVIEKDYVIGWLLWGIGSQPEIRHAWIFKGGTSLIPKTRALKRQNFSNR